MPAPQNKCRGGKCTWKACPELHYCNVCFDHWPLPHYWPISEFRFHRGNNTVCNRCRAYDESPSEQRIDCPRQKRQTTLQNGCTGKNCPHLHKCITCARKAVNDKGNANWEFKPQRSQQCLDCLQGTLRRTPTKDITEKVYRIPLGLGRGRDLFAIVDMEEEAVANLMWTVDPSGQKVYVMRTENGIPVYLHKVLALKYGILSPDEGKEVQIDHINRNTLDNRRDNLRRCTISQNSLNRDTRPNARFGWVGIIENQYSGKFQFRTDIAIPKAFKLQVNSLNVPAAAWMAACGRFLIDLQFTHPRIMKLDELEQYWPSDTPYEMKAAKMLLFVWQTIACRMHAEGHPIPAGSGVLAVFDRIYPAMNPSEQVGYDRLVEKLRKLFHLLNITEKKMLLSDPRPLTDEDYWYIGESSPYIPIVESTEMAPCEENCRNYTCRKSHTCGDCKKVMERDAKMKPKPRDVYCKTCKDYRLRDRSPRLVDSVWCIRISDGQDVYFDEDDKAMIQARKWSAKPKSLGATYACRNGDDFGLSTVYMHHVIMLHHNKITRDDIRAGIQIDHINRNSLDNRKANLQSVTGKQNARNRKNKTQTQFQWSGVRAVFGLITYRGIIRTELPDETFVQILLGTFPTEAEAAWISSIAKMLTDINNFAYNYMNMIEAKEKLGLEAAKRLLGQCLEYMCASVHRIRKSGQEMDLDTLLPHLKLVLDADSDITNLHAEGKWRLEALRALFQKAAITRESLANMLLEEATVVSSLTLEEDVSDESDDEDE